MLQPGPPHLLTKLGKAMEGKSPAFVFAVSMSALVLFVAVTGFIINSAGRTLAASFGMESDPVYEQQEPEASFEERYGLTTDASYKAFFDLGLSKANFIDRWTRKKQENEIQYEYIFWQLWVKNDFDFKEALELFNAHVAGRVPGLFLQPSQVDAKTFQIVLKLDGIETHKVVLTKTSVEAEKDVASVEWVDIEKKIPQAQYRGAAKVAIIIDDIGNTPEIERRFLNVGANLTFAVLPYSPKGAEFATEAHGLGHEILLHMPMEPKAYPQIRPGKGGLLLSMNQGQIQQTVGWNLKQVPYISGVNNHMGSAFTSSVEKMVIVLEQLKQKGLFFVDSRTAGSSKAYEVAQNLGVPSAARNVFLDHEPTPDHITGQFDLLVKVARRKGTAIAIGHPNTHTLHVLQNRIPELASHNIIVVPPSQIVH